MTAKGRLGRYFHWLESGPIAAWLASAVVHASLLLILSLAIFAAPTDSLMWLVDGGHSPPLEAMNLDELQVDEIPVPGVVGEATLGPVAKGDAVSLPGPITGTVGNARTGPTNAGAATSSADSDSPQVAVLRPVDEFGSQPAAGFEALSNPLATRGGGLEGRKFENRLEAALAGGGTHESERAVELGLAWLAEHQFADGGWRFDLEQHPSCAGYCRDSGSYTTTTAATGLALLSFLGAGYTHEEGKYSEVVSRGLYYLSGRMEITTHGGDLRDDGGRRADMELGLSGGFRGRRMRDDTMYSQGIAALALTEAYAMTHDPALQQSAEEAVKFIISAQYDDGGWRYEPAWENNTNGDMTVTGWQMAALKSGLLAGIDVPYEVWQRASEFIDTLEYEDGARYSYTGGGRGSEATSAIGLLCRMIGGWPRESRALQRGAAQIGDLAPHQNNVYFIYYSSQVLHHLGGPRWQKWNPRMRNYLVETQATDGHETGSWYFAESHSSAGGRLYTTAMAIMTLEVYYRYMPLYGESFVERAP